LKARIILPTDGSEPARWAAEFVCRTLRVPAAACDVTLVHVDTPFPVRARNVLGREVVQALHERASSKAVEPARRVLARQRVPHKAAFLVGNAGERIASFARARRVDLLVMGARGLGAFRAFVLGSTSQRVLAGCSVPAIIVRRRPAPRMVRNVLIATDGSDSSARAVRALLKLRRLFHPEPRITLAHAVMPVSARVAAGLKLGPRDRYYASVARTATKDAVALLRRQRLRCEEVVLVGDPGRTIADHATRGRFDLIVMGSHGRGAAKALVLGSVAQRVLARCAVPALVVR
jgi:nucleotide-binding universal stress UspA family protein